MKDQYAIYRIIFIVLSVTSSVSLFLIFIAFLMQKALRHYSNWQIIFLSIAAFISCISYLINYRGFSVIDTKGGLCICQGFIMLWSDMSLYSWTTLINYSLYYYTIHFDKIRSDIIPLTWWIGDAIIGYFIPFSYALILLSLDQIGVNGDYCWIKEQNAKQETLQVFNAALFITYVIAWFFMFANIGLTSKVIAFICRLNTEEKNYVKDFAKKLLMFPVIQMIASAPLTFYRILFFIKGTERVRAVMEYLGLYGFACMGISIAFVFGKNMNIHETVFKCCFKKQEMVAVSDDSTENIYGFDLRSSILDDTNSPLSL